MESRKMILINRFSGQQRKGSNGDTQQACDTQQEGAHGTNRESSTETHILPYVK